MKMALDLVSDADKTHENEMATQKNADTICQWHIMKIDLIKRMADRNGTA